MLGRKARFLPAFIIGLLLVVSACGSSSGTSSDSGSGQQTISVGVICTCSGPFGNTGGTASKVAQAWANSVNSAGGVSGHHVELKLSDDSSDPGKSVIKIQEFVSAKVDVILDLSVLDSAWAKFASQAKIPVVGGGFNHDPYYQDPYFYPSGQTNDSITYAVVATAKQAGATNFGQLYCAESPQCQQSIELIKSAGQQLGVPDVYAASISKTAPNYTAQCLAAQQAGVTALIVEQSAPVIVNVAKDCDRQGYHPIYVIEGTGFTMQEPSAAGLRDNLWAPFPDIPFFADTPFVQKMNSVLDQYYPGLRTNPVDWAQNSVQTWTGGLLIQAAVAAAGVGPSNAVSAADVSKGLDSQQGATLDGWSPPLTFAAGKPHPVKCWFTARVQNGTPALANDGKPTCL